MVSKSIHIPHRFGDCFVRELCDCITTHYDYLRLDVFFFRLFLFSFAELIVLLLYVRNTITITIQFQWFAENISGQNSTANIEKSVFIAATKKPQRQESFICKKNTKKCPTYVQSIHIFSSAAPQLQSFNVVFTVR